MDLEIREFSVTLKNFVSNSKIPMEVKRIILSDILREIEEKTNAEIVTQFAERESKENQAEESEE